jgi:amino acid transporter
VGDYAARLFALGPNTSALYAAVVVILLTGLNVAGVRPGSAAQNLLTTGVVLGLLGLVGVGLTLAEPGGGPAPLAQMPSEATPAFGLSMVFVLLTYGGWNEAAYVSAEVQTPRRNLVRALTWSVLVVTGLYLLVNSAYLRGLGLTAMAASPTVAADLVERAVGPAGGNLVSALIVLAAVTSMNATIFTGARTAYALGRDFPPLRFLGRWSAGTETPVNALLAQGGIALGLTLFGGQTRMGFETMVEYTAPVFWLFLLLAGISLFVLRRREPAAAAFRVPLYPLTPLCFCCTSVYLLYASLVYTGVGALVGVAVLAVGGLILAAASR